MLRRTAFQRSIAGERGLVAMASVFLSYDHEDGALAAPIAAALEVAGHSVWWDRHIQGGAEYNSEIENAVERADAVVVLWSERSVKSAWVRDEAAEGRDSGKLVPVTIDAAKPPMGFRQFQTIPLSRAKGRKPSAEIGRLLLAIDTVTRSKTDAPVQPSPQLPKNRETRLWSRWPFVGAGAVALAGIGLFVWRPWQTEAASTVVILAADRSVASQNYARDLLAQLGQLQSAKSDRLRLVGPDTRKPAGLVFEVTGTAEGGQARANLLLLDGPGGDLIWSSSFERPINQIGDLRQQLGYTAANVLQCAVEAHKGGSHALKRDILKQYLNGCAQASDSEGEALLRLIPVFRRVVEAAPDFEGAWSRLLRTETDTYAGGNFGIRAQIARDIVSARKVNPQISAAYLAEYDLLPNNAFGQRLSVIDRAVASNPDDSAPVGFRSETLFAVGRVRESLDDARRAVDLDPISPRVRQNYIMSLAQSGRTQAALDEISKAERIWPGSEAVTDARFAVHLRFGDPRIAWQMIQAGQVQAAWIDARSFIEARMRHRPEDIELALKDAKAAYAVEPFAFQHVVQTYSILDREDELLPILMSAPIKDAVFVTDVTFRPAARELWRNPQAFRYARRVGLLSYWQSSGKWPDFCFETDLPYDCKTEAAKLAGRHS